MLEFIGKAVAIVVLVIIVLFVWNRCIDDDDNVIYENNSSMITSSNGQSIDQTDTGNNGYCGYSGDPGNKRRPSGKNGIISFSAHEPVAGFFIYYENGESASRMFDPNPPIGGTVQDGVVWPWIEELERDHLSCRQR